MHYPHPSPASRTASRRHPRHGQTLRRRTLWIVVQEGRAWTEHYATSYGHLTDARRAMAALARAGFRTKGPIPVTAYEDPAGRRVLDEPDVLALIHELGLTPFADPCALGARCARLDAEAPDAP